jgi:hypothetical protein
VKLPESDEDWVNAALLQLIELLAMPTAIAGYRWQCGGSNGRNSNSKAVDSQLFPCGKQQLVRQFERNVSVFRLAKCESKDNGPICMS